ncbi:L-aspartate oxidase [Flavobacteriales bacterium]|nr:L-aspartate oxidase [Flavobacteriales bacterium]
MSIRKVDYLVIGSGIAGLSFSLKMAEIGKVLIITKSDKEESNTKYAQGGIAAVWYEGDSYEKHIEDTMVAGAGLNDKDVVDLVIRKSTKRIKELIEWGARFDKEENGQYDLVKEGGHSEYRILHHKDVTGFEIERALIEEVTKHPNIEISDHHFALDLITQHHLGETVKRAEGGIECYGAYVLNNASQKIETILAKSTILAAGGAGQVYSTTTNPGIATGDGIAMAYRAKAEVADMEFVQFHPTSLYLSNNQSPSFLISEAVRGHGAILRNHKGEQFMPRYDERGSLAPRDIVAQAIDNEMKKSGHDFMYLDCCDLDLKDFMDHFPNIYETCTKNGIDITKDWIPVVPAAHYICGGVKVDQQGRTSIKNLMAFGECACTGLHGANRLASNSLLEAIVFSNEASKYLSNIELSDWKQDVPSWDDDGMKSPEEMVLITQSLKEVKALMSNYVGIVRSELRLKRALDRLEILYRETEDLYHKATVSVKLCELRNLINVAFLIIKFASQRKESVGLHYVL